MKKPDSSGYVTVVLLSLCKYISYRCVCVPHVSLEVLSQLYISDCFLKNYVKCHPTQFHFSWVFFR